MPAFAKNFDITVNLLAASGKEECRQIERSFRTSQIRRHALGCGQEPRDYQTAGSSNYEH